MKLPTAIAILGYSITGHAALYDRGGGMIYDSTLDITWLQDANYAKTSGYSATGLMTFDEAQNWVSDLTYAGVTGWRLPSANGSGASQFTDPDGQVIVSGSMYAVGTDSTTGVPITESEMGSLYYISLKNRVGVLYPPLVQSEFTNSGFIDPTTGQAVSFLNIKSSWINGVDAPPDTNWVFNMHGGIYGLYGGGDGTQFTLGNTYCTGQIVVTCGHPIVQQAWAVHDGDVATVPISGAAWLFGSGLIGLAGIKRKKNS